MDNKKIAIIAGVGIAVAVAVAVSKKSEAAPEEPVVYCCPLEPSVCFDSAAELEAHMAAAHPPTLIDISWE